MSDRMDRFGVDDDDQIKPRSKRRGDKPARGYRPQEDRDGFGTRKTARRPELEEDDDFLDLDEDLDDEDLDDDLGDFDDFDDLEDLDDLDDPDDLL